MNFENGSLAIRILKHVVSPHRYARIIGVRIGKNCFIPDKDTWSSEPYLIKVGDHCQITMGVRIFTHGGGVAMRVKYPDFDSFGRVEIGNHVYIGNNALIMPGVTIGDNCVIAAGSVVTKSIPSGYVVGGNPAKIICKTEEYIERNAKYNTHSKGFSVKQKRAYISCLPDNKFIIKPSICD